MTDTYRRILLDSRPRGLVDQGNLRIDDSAPIPEPAEGQALVRVRYCSIDPTIRTWMDDAPGYLPPIGIGEVVRSGGVGEVVASRNEHYQPGDVVFGMLGWQEFSLADAGDSLTVLPPGVDPTVAIGVLGVTGMTAYFGLFDIGRPRPGDTVVVSGAAGATGSVVGQLARIEGAGSVVGIAGIGREVRLAHRRVGLRPCHQLPGRRCGGPAPGDLSRTGSTSTSTTWAARS